MESLRKVKSRLETKFQQSEQITVLDKLAQTFPKEVFFEDVQSNQFYEITLHIRNQSKEIQKVRLIPPATLEFKLQCDEREKCIAQGLAWKIPVQFSSVKQSELEGEFEDSIVILGNNFKKTIKLIAHRPRQDIIMPEIFKIGNLKVSKQYNFSIPLHNKGKVQALIQIDVAKQSIIEVSEKTFTIKPGKSSNLQFKLKSKKIGIVNEQISVNKTGGQALSGTSIIKVKGLFIDEQFDLVDKYGTRLTAKDFGEVFIGQTIIEPFYVINNSSNQIEFLAKTFNKQVAEYMDVKIDEKRLNFVNRQSPQGYIKEINEMSTKCGEQRFTVQPFSDYESHFTIHKKPYSKETDKFRKAILKPNEASQYNPFITNQQNQTLVCKISGEDKIMKIPIKFSPVIPKIRVSCAVVDFGKVPYKHKEEQQITIKNLSSRQVLLSYERGQTFHLQVPPSIGGYDEVICKISFHPVVMGKYYQVLTIKVFNIWPIDIKAFAVCPSESCLSSSLKKNLFNVTSAKTMTLNKSCSSKAFGQRFLNTCTASCTREISSKLKQRDIFNSTTQNFYLPGSGEENVPVERRFLFNKSPHMKDPDCKLDTLKNQLYLKKNRAIKANIKNTSSHPLNIREVLKYSEELTPAEIEMIEVKDLKVDFGSIFVNSESEKQLLIRNKNNKTVLIELDLNGYESLSLKNGGTHRRISAYSEERITISLKPSQLGNMRFPVTYIINNQHIFEIEVMACVTLVNLELSTKIINFSFKESQLEFEKSEKLVIRNEGNTITKFTFSEPDNKVFTISQTSGQLKPKSSITVSIKYQPKYSGDSGQTRVDNDRFVMKVLGGAENVIKCIGVVSEAKCSLRQNELSFPSVYVSSSMTGRIYLKNNSKVFTVFKVEISPNLQEHLAIDNNVMGLISEERKELNFTFICNEIKRVQGTILIHIRGSRTFKLPFDTNVAYPQIQVDIDEIDFGTLPIMSNHCQQTIMLKNLSMAEVLLQFSKEMKDESYSLEMNALKQENLHLSQYKEQDRNNKNENFSIDRRGSLREGSHERKIYSCYKNTIKLSPGVQSYFVLKFIPKQIKEFNFLLPLTMQGTAKPVEPVHQIIKCNAVQPLIYISPQEIDFESRILNEKKSIFMKELKLSNPHDEHIKWRINVPSENYSGSIFIFAKTEGNIPPHSTELVEVLFRPKVEGVYHEKYNMFLNDMNLSYFEIKISGSAVLPTISFNCNESILPVVPLGVEAKTSIRINNHGYDTITICKWKTSNHFQFVDIKVNFLEGKLLSLAKKSLKVEISFMSLVAISFTTILEFYDEFGNKYELPLSATADNSILTAYPFLEAENQHSIFLDPAQHSIKAVGVSRSYTQESESVSGLKASSCNFIEKWLNYEINLGIRAYPVSLVETEGELFMKMVNRIAGKSIIRKPEISGDNISRILSLYDYYCEGIRTLKVEGAFLNHIRPEYLLNENDFIIFNVSRKMILQKEFSYQPVLVESWITLFYQLCKLYIMPQITEKSMQKLVRFENVPSSTIYSHPEVLILTYLDSYLADDHLYSFADQSKIMDILQKMLEKFFSIALSHQMASLKISVAIMGAHQFLPLISNFLYTQLKEFGLSLYLQPNDLFAMNQKELCLYMVSLINMLVQYNTINTIKFEASIGQRITKTIELENPSGKKIRYWVKVIGSQDFQPEMSEITLGGKQKMQLNVSYHCKVSRQDQAKLLLVPSKEEDSLAPAQPLVFLLKTSIISKVTVQKINITACLYQVVPIILDVELPFEPLENGAPGSNEFHLTLTEEPTPSETSYQSFFFNHSPLRNLKDAKDRIEIKILSLVMERKFCKVIYTSTVYGEYVYEINVIIDHPPILREIRMKQLKVNKEDSCQIFLNRQNQPLQNALKFLQDQDIKVKKPPPNPNGINSIKYNLLLPESQYLKLQTEILDVDRSYDKERDKNESLKVDITANFNKAFKQYSCVLIMKNDSHKDIRAYRLITMVTTLPKVISLSFKTPARQQIIQKIPVKIVPCSIIYSQQCPAFSIENYTEEIYSAGEMNLVFNPKWIFEDQVSITMENKETLEQLIYKIKLQATQPLPFDFVTVRGSSIFKRKVELPLNFVRTEELNIRLFLKRKHELIDPSKTKCIQKVQPNSQKLHLVLFPSKEEEDSTLRLIKTKCDEYYWMKLAIKNKPVRELGSVTLTEKIGSSRTYHLEKVDPTCSDFQYYFDQEDLAFLNVEISSEGAKRRFTVHFTPYKEIKKSLNIYFLMKDQEYRLELMLNSEPFAPIILPEIVANNTEFKITTINVINSSPFHGKYKLEIEGSKCFTLDSCHQASAFEIRPKEKVTLRISFLPQYLNQFEKAVIKLISNQLPNYQYLITGYSQFLTVNEIITFESFEGIEVEKTINFVNDFSKKEGFTIEITPAKSPFRILDPRETTFELKPKEIKTIRILSRNLKQTQLEEGVLSIKSSERKSWTYDLKLYTIKNFSEKAYSWQCKCRENIFESIDLPGNFQLTDLETEPQIKKFLTFSLEQSESNQIKVKFSPMKPIKKKIYSVILVGKKFKYRISCLIHVEEPDYDDTILIRSGNTNETKCVSFRLTNVVKQTAKYRAYFEKRHPQLTVEPVLGVLEPYGRAGTLIYLKFCSSTNNKKVEDNLIIETDEMHWIFRVKAQLLRK